MYQLNTKQGKLLISKRLQIIIGNGSFDLLDKIDIYQPNLF